MIPRIPFEAVQSVEIVIHLLNINPYTNYLLIESCKLIETVACRWHTLDKQRIIILYASFYFYSLSSDLQMDFVCAQKHYACMRVRLASTDKMPAQIFNSSEPITPPISEGFMPTTQITLQFFSSLPAVNGDFIVVLH